MKSPKETRELLDSSYRKQYGGKGEREPPTYKEAILLNLEFSDKSRRKAIQIKSTGELSEAYSKLKTAFYQTQEAPKLTEAEKAKFYDMEFSRAERLEKQAKQLRGHRGAGDIYFQAEDLKEDIAHVRKELKAKPGKLETVTATASVIGFIGSFIFLSTNITGNAISDFNQTSSNWIGAALFIIGLIGAFAYFRKR